MFGHSFIRLADLKSHAIHFGVSDLQISKKPLQTVHNDVELQIGSQFEIPFFFTGQVGEDY